jgi:hypothetical protein
LLGASEGHEHEMRMSGLESSERRLARGFVVLEPRRRRIDPNHTQRRAPLAQPIARQLADPRPAAEEIDAPPLGGRSLEHRLDEVGARNPLW